MDDEISAIVRAERTRINDAARRRDKRLERAREAAPEIASELARIDTDVREVWLFGSLASGRVRDENFDIDLAVCGGDIISLYAHLPESEFEIDLVDLDSVSEGFRETVMRRGERIYDAGR